MERELTSPVRLCTDSGALAPDAVGWSRRPLHRCNLSGHVGRKKRWNHWAIATERFFLTVTVADVDFVGLAVVTLFDLATGKIFERAALSPLALGFAMPETLDGEVAIDMLGLEVALVPGADGTSIEARARTLRGERLELDAFVAAPKETLNVVIPWSADRFAFTSKHVGLAASGALRVGGALHELDGRAFAILDFGRGVWPRETTWHWAAASGAQSGRAIGLNLGARWTDGSGFTENAICVGGRLTKLHEEVAFERGAGGGWAAIKTRASDRVALAFEPVHARTLALSLGLARARLHFQVGRFRGRVVAENGEAIELAPLLGSAEEFEALW